MAKQKLNDEVLDLTIKIKQQNYEPIHSDKPFVFCAPTYVCESPGFFDDYAKRTELSGNKDVYFISTCGGYSGISGVIFGRIIKNKGLNYKGYTDFVLPSNYIANKNHKDDELSEIEKKIQDAQKKIESVALAVIDGKDLKYRHIWMLEILIDYLLAPIFSIIGHRVKGFYADEHCISCGACVRNCPLNIISLDDNKPVWTGKTCAHCMKCIQNCPTNAIEYKDITKGRKRYRLDYYRYVSDKKTDITQ